MNVVTQISGHIHPDSTALHALKNMLTQLGIYVTQPIQDESLFYGDAPNIAWQRYNNELFFYESIANSQFHILYSGDKIDENTCREIVYAILQDRPIFICGSPVFSNKVSTFTRDLIVKHIPQFHSMNLPELELTELSRLLKKVKNVDYNLLGSEKILINAGVNAYFRTLFDMAKDNSEQ